MTPRKSERGHTLVEVLIVVAITLLVLLLVYSLTRVGVRLADSTNGRLDRETVALRSLEAMSSEIARAGYGLALDVPPLVPEAPPAGQPSRSLVIRSRPEPGGAHREVRFRFENGTVTRAIDGRTSQVLATRVADLAFEFLDDLGSPVAPWRVPSAGALVRTVRVGFTMLPAPGDVAPFEQRLSVGLESQGTTLRFDPPPEHAFQLRRVFVRLPNAVAVVSRPHGDSGVAVVDSPAGCNALYMFPLESLIGDVRIDSVGALEGVCDVRGAAFAPEESAWAGSLLLARGALRSAQVFRVVPDAEGRLGPGAPVVKVADTELLKSVTGAALDHDAVFVADGDAGIVYRHALDAEASSFTSAAVLPGIPGPMAFGLDGVLYALVAPAQGGGGDTLWSIPVDASGTPRPLARLEGRGRSLAFDPVTGSIFALVLDRADDSVLLEFSRRALHDTAVPPEVRFRLSEWKAEVESAFPPLDPTIPPLLFPERLSFASFDANGTLYFGASEVSLVLQGELDRPGLGRRKVGLSGLVGVDGRTLRPRTLLQAWKK